METERSKSWYEPIAYKTEQIVTEEELNSLPEWLILKFLIPSEPKEEVNFDGFCECDHCRKFPKEAIRLSKGKTVFLLDQKLIYCDCLKDYLIQRMGLLR